jgi:hypothetical protein
MKLKTTLTIVAVCCLVTGAFSQTNPLVRHLPGNASMIISFNPVRLGSKVSPEIFRQSFLYKEMMGKKGGGKDLMALLAKSGIDFSTDLLIGFVYDTSNFSTYTCILGKLNNASAFTSMVQDNIKDDSIHVYGNNKIRVTGGGAIAWNNDLFVFSAGGNMPSSRNLVSVTTDSTVAIMDTIVEADTATTRITVTNEVTEEERLKNEQWIEKIRVEMFQDLKDRCFSLLSGDAKNNFGSDTRLQALLNEPGDIKIWNKGTPNPVLGRMFGMGNLANLGMLSGTTKTSVINFENGKIVTKGRNYINQSLADVYSKYPALPLNTELARRLPAGKVIGLLATSYDPAIGKEMIEKTGAGNLFEEMKGKMPFDVTLLATSFKSNILLAVLDGGEAGPNDVSDQKKEGVRFIMAIPIANTAKFETLRTSVAHFIDSMKKAEPGEKMFGKGFNPAVRYNSELCVIASSAQVAEAFLADPGTGVVPEWLETYKQHPFVLQVDLHRVFTEMLGKSPSGKNNMGMEERKIVDNFDKILVYGGEFEGGALHQTMEIRFANTNENSLKQLFQIVNMAAEASENSLRRYDSDPPPQIELDTPVPPPRHRR